MTAGPATSFSPDLRTGDELGGYWLHQAALRLRREVAWRWHARQHAGADAARLVESLDQIRHWEAKRRFFAEDPAGAYLTRALAEPFAGSLADAPRGSFAWLAAELDLDRVSTFALALALLGAFDSAAGPVIATCLNDPTRTVPSLELVQRLWERPEHVLGLTDPGHPLWERGILAGATALGWETPLAVAPLVAAQLLFGRAAATPGLAPLTATASPGLDVELARASLAARTSSGLTVMPVQGQPGADFEGAVSALAAGLRVLRLDAWPERREDPAALRALLTRGWLLGDAIFLPPPAAEPERFRAALAGAREIPAVLFVAVHERAQLAGLPSELLVSPLTLPPLDHGRRAALWRARLARRGADLDAAIPECARRFRFEAQTIGAVAETLNALGRAPAPADLLAACRAEVRVETGGLAEPVTPRFADDELVLGADRRRQLEEIHGAMASLAEVHYEWGTARAWNEAGITVLFAGPPGTGKTMAAEILARRLDMPMYRIDLSQVVDKYIGVTEKNLKRLFDAADRSDIVLFFDEADSLFGRRTEVRDAHDRYANLEISYLLERMERSKGLAILATNRRKDLDEAFVRRLRFIVEFPLPDAPEREQIWRRVIPPRVDASALDIPFLARQFPLAGGHIRAIVFAACLQSETPALTMETVVVAVKREYDKLRRAIALEQFGPYAATVEGVGS